MDFRCIDWADSSLDRIEVENDWVVLTIWNDTFQKMLEVECTGVVGITNVCIWDDTIINGTEMAPVEEDDEFIDTLRTCCKKACRHSENALKKELYVLSIELVNYTTLKIYCQSADVRRAPLDPEIEK